VLHGFALGQAGTKPGAEFVVGLDLELKNAVETIRKVKS